MCEFLRKIDKCLSSFDKLKITGFSKRSRNHVGDYQIHCCESATDMLPDIKSRLTPDLASVISEWVFNEKWQCAFMNFNRSSVFMLGIEDFLLSECLKEFKLINYKCEITCNDTEKDDLTSLRLSCFISILRNAVTELSCCNSDDNTFELRVSRSHQPHQDDSKVVIVGPVHGSSSLNSEQYRNLRREGILFTNEFKLDTNPEFHYVDDLVDIAIGYDLLHTNIHKVLNLNLDTSTATSHIASSKEPVFIAYNYVRLSKLLSCFDSKVRLGDYSSLPPLSDIDFSLLKLEDEWSLMFDYILYWPCLLEKCFQSLKDGQVKLHLLFMFLFDMSSRFSQYYHRTRILVAPWHDLMNVLNARIYLLKTLIVIYQHAFDILMIKPPPLM